MDPLRNPFSPGAGARPPELAGRKELLDHALLSLARTKRGRSEKNMMIVGLRGAGKTVLLNEIYHMAEKEGYKVIAIEAHENMKKKGFAGLLLPYLRQALYSLNAGEQRSEKARHALRVLKSFISGLTVKFNDIEVGLDIDAAIGAADSGDLEADLAQVFIAIGEAAQDRNTAIALIIDELQYLNNEELGALIMAMHKVAQKSLPIVLVGAGLPQLVAMAGNAKTYAERLFDYPQIGPLEKKDAISALQEPVKEEGAEFTDEALDQVVEITEGYPYFLQEWGYQAWNLAETSPIEVEVIKQATKKSIERLDESFFRVRFDRLTPKEKKYVRALAALGPEPQRSGDIAKQLKVQVSQVATTREYLIQKGMVYSPSHGLTAFTVPLFDEFIKRVME